MCAEIDRSRPVVRRAPMLRCAVHGQHGQALTEALVAALVLAPLVFAIVLLGKIQTLQMATIAASRTLAFECAVRPGECADSTGQSRLVAEVRDRHFTRGDRPITSHPTIIDRVPQDDAQALWTGPARQPLLPDLSAVRAGFQWGSFDAGASVSIGQGQSQFANAATLLDRLAGPGRFGLGVRDGLLEARIETSLPGVPPLAARALDALALNFRARTAILVDDWSAARAIGPEPDTLQSRVAQGQRIDPLHEAAQPIAYQLTIWSIQLMGMIGLEGQARHFRYHDSDVALLPPDRVAP